MLKSIKSFFASHIEPTPAPTSGSSTDEAAQNDDRVRLAAVALLLELAHADDEFSAEEREYLEDALVRQFGTSEEEVKRLIELAHEEHRSAIDHYQFTSLIAESFDLGQKMVLAEMMWGLVGADGTIVSHEAYLVRKISNLLQLEPGYLSAAKRQAMDKS